MGLVLMTLHNFLLPLSGLKDSLVSWIMAPGNMEKIVFLLQHFLFSIQTPETLRYDFPLGPVKTSLKQDGSRAGVWQAEILELRGCAVAAGWSLAPSQVM